MLHDERYGAPNLRVVDSPATRKDSATREAQREGLLRTAFMSGLASRYTFINQTGDGSAAPQ